MFKVSRKRESVAIASGKEVFSQKRPLSLSSFACTVGTFLVVLTSSQTAFAANVRGELSGVFDPHVYYDGTFDVRTTEPFFTHVEGNFLITDGTPDSFGPPNVGAYRLSNFDFSFFKGTNLVKRLAADNTNINLVGGLTIDDNFGSSTQDALFIDIGYWHGEAPNPVFIWSFSPRFYGLPGTTFTSDALPTTPLTLMGDGSGNIYGLGINKVSFNVAGDPFQLGQRLQSVTLRLNPPPPDSQNSVPTPALLPGLIGLGWSVLRKRKAEGTAVLSEGEQL